MFTEGFSSAITAVMAMDGAKRVLVLNFRGIPDGVTVTASLMGTGEAMEDDGTDLAPLTLVTGGTQALTKTAWSVCHSWRGGDQVHFRHSTYDHDNDMAADGSCNVDGELIRLLQFPR